MSATSLRCVLALGCLPRVEVRSCAVFRRVHRLVVIVSLGCQFDDVSVRVAKVNRVDELVIGDAARLDVGPLALVEPARKGIGRDFQRDVQVEVVLVLELKRHVERLEEREARPVVHRIERVQRVGAATALGLCNLERVDQRQPEEFLVELPGLFRVATAIGVVMQSLDHAPMVSNG